MSRMKQLLHDMESFRYSPQFKQTVDDMMTTGGYTYEQIASKVEVTVDELHHYLSLAT